MRSWQRVRRGALVLVAVAALLGTAVAPAAALPDWRTGPAH